MADNLILSGNRSLDKITTFNLLTFLYRCEQFPLSASYCIRFAISDVSKNKKFSTYSCASKEGEDDEVKCVILGKTL